MSNGPNGTKPSTPSAPKASAVSRSGFQSSAAGQFCPKGGLFANSSLHFREELRCRLRERLRLAGTILFTASLLFLIRAQFFEGVVYHLTSAGAVGQVVLTVLLGFSVAFLTFWKHPTLNQLRVNEFVIFGAPAALFVWVSYFRFCHTAQLEPLMIGTFLAQNTVPWILLMTVYGVFVPNTFQRAAAFVSVMSVIPIVGAWVCGHNNPQLGELLFERGGFFGSVLWIGIAAVSAIYGSHRIGSMNRQIFDVAQVGSYTLREKLGAGGMGEVYLAEHHLLKRRCAIKLIRSEKAEDANAIARFESEVQATARLTHLNTVEIFDYGHTEDGTFYYAMEYLPGMNLQEIVERYGPLPPERVVHLLKPVASALREAHSTGLVHRDIKPGNIFAAERGGVYDVPKLLDFGLVKSYKRDPDAVKLTIEGAVVGSPLFASPEIVFDTEPDARSDIYSLGATAYFLLTGRPVFQGSSPLKILFSHANEPVKAPSSVVKDIPADLEAVVMKCLSKQAEDRYQSAEELEAALESVKCNGLWTARRAAEWWTRTQSEQAATPLPTIHLEDATIMTPQVAIV